MPRTGQIFFGRFTEGSSKKKIEVRGFPWKIFVFFIIYRGGGAFFGGLSKILKNLQKRMENQNCRQKKFNDLKYSKFKNLFFLKLASVEISKFGPIAVIKFWWSFSKKFDKLRRNFKKYVGNFQVILLKLRKIILRKIRVTRELQASG